VAAIPTGKQNTFAAHTRPGFILAVVRDSGVPINLANAFMRPAQPRDWGREEDRRDLLAVSEEALSNHWTELTAMYEKTGIKILSACWMPKNLSLPAFDGHRVPNNTFNEVVQNVMEALPKEV
jgi:CRISPR system Cascade subunit CasC